MISTVYKGIMGASTVVFSGAYGYQQYKETKSLDRTFAGCIIGGLLGLGFGAVWPISVGVFVARKMADT